MPRASALAAVADDGLVLIDGLVAGRSADAVAAESGRLRVVVLAHMVSEAFPDADPTAVEEERRALARRSTASSRPATGPARSWCREESRRPIASASPGRERMPLPPRTAQHEAVPCSAWASSHRTRVRTC